LAYDKKFILVARDECSGWMVAVPMPSKTSPQIAQAFHQVFGFAGIETIRADPGREFDGEFGRRAALFHVKLDVSVPARPQTHSRSERFHRELENVVRTYLYQSGLPYTFWAEAVRMATENMNRTADVGKVSPHELRFGSTSRMTLAPFGAGVRYLIEERPRGRKLAPRSAPGLAIGYATAKALRVLDLEKYIATQNIKVVTTRDYRFVPGADGPFSFPYVEMAGLQSPDKDWSFAVPSEQATSDARGVLPLCHLCGRPIPDDEDLRNPCPACNAETGRRPKCWKKTNTTVHTHDVRCLQTRCRCAEKLQELVPTVEIEANDEDSEIPEGFIDFAGVSAERLEFPEPGGDDAVAMALVTRAVSLGSVEAKTSSAAQRALKDAMDLLINKAVFPQFGPG
jgi:hypothetical protein